MFYDGIFTDTCFDVLCHGVIEFEWHFVLSLAITEIEKIRETERCQLCLIRVVRVYFYSQPEKKQNKTEATLSRAIINIKSFSNTNALTRRPRLVLIFYFIFSVFHYLRDIDTQIFLVSVWCLYVNGCGIRERISTELKNNKRLTKFMKRDESHERALPPRNCINSHVFLYTRTIMTLASLEALKNIGDLVNSDLSYSSQVGNFRSRSFQLKFHFGFLVCLQKKSFFEVQSSVIKKEV